MISQEEAQKIREVYQRTGSIADDSQIFEVKKAQKKPTKTRGLRLPGKVSAAKAQRLFSQKSCPEKAHAVCRSPAFYPETCFDVCHKCL